MKSKGFLTSIFVIACGALPGFSLVAMSPTQHRDPPRPAAGRGGPPAYELSRWTVDGGGAAQSTGGDFELSGTIGQPDAGTLSGGDFTLTGGFWFMIPPGDCEDDGDVDLSDYALFRSCMTGPGGAPPTGACRCFDVDHSGTVDLRDFAVAQTTFTGS